MDFIVDFVVSIFFHRIGICVLRLVTFGRFPENNSYLKSIPVFVGFFSFVVFVVLMLLVASMLRGWL